mmetsp:Transcript_107468/g.208183  ORF Transcript_107468/g.208183 Transcript_107468/m.208183 type:complete len:216 (+) Transcript_107468:76-723(+)
MPWRPDVVNGCTVPDYLGAPTIRTYQTPFKNDGHEQANDRGRHDMGDLDAAKTGQAHCGQPLEDQDKGNDQHEAHEHQPSFLLVQRAPISLCLQPICGDLADPRTCTFTAYASGCSGVAQQPATIARRTLGLSPNVELVGKDQDGSGVVVAPSGCLGNQAAEARNLAKGAEDLQEPCEYKREKKMFTALVGTFVWKEAVCVHNFPDSHRNRRDAG